MPLLSPHIISSLPIPSHNEINIAKQILIEVNGC
ncbi:unnamed protein product [Nezara viridula]|uniref:Uncharacterized protein n=1 Tax=Nezara viridula TaxID=85310 RepID=A0A9P0E911_NEZVI|nr:unnamed protein product [Nezara viridula]